MASATSAIDVAKNFIENSPTYNHMSDGTYQTTQHDTSLDSHSINMLDGVDHSDSFDNEYHVVTVSKNITVEGGFELPKILKVQISNENTVQSVLESK